MANFKIGKFRCCIERVCELYSEKGIGLSYAAGCTGSTFDTPGTNHFFDLKVLLWWPFRLGVYWKRLP